MLSVGAFSQSSRMTLAGVWTDTTILGSATSRYNDCWGFVEKGREYGVIGSKFGTHIIDVTDPHNPVEIDRVAGKHSATDVIHRDFKTYKGYLYAVGDQGSASLQIMDLSFLPDSVHVVYDDSSLITKSHNIFIDTLNGRLYSCGGATSIRGSELRILDINNPTAPFLLTDAQDSIAWWSSTIGYVHDVFVRDNIAYLNDEDAMHVVDFTNIKAPTILGALTSYIDQGYNHSGWVHEDDSTYVMLDETSGKRIKIIDVGDLSDIKVTDVISARPDTINIIGHNALINGDYAYISYYGDGIYVYDLADRYDVKLVAFYDTYPGNSGGGRGCWGVYPFLPSGNILASDRTTGLNIMQFEKPVINYKVLANSVSEDIGNTFIEIDLSYGVSHPVSVELNLKNTSTASDQLDFDFGSFIPYTFHFTPNTNKKQFIQLSIIDDGIVEQSERAFFDLVNAKHATVGVNNSFELTINDNDGLSSLNKLTLNKLKVYPNPVRKGDDIQFNQSISFQLFDVLGNLVKNQVMTTNLSTKGLEKGTYLLKSKKGNTRIVIN